VIIWGNPGNLTSDFIIPELFLQDKLPLRRDFVTPVFSFGSRNTGLTANLRTLV
jgi:hypothetical protein